MTAPAWAGGRPKTHVCVHSLLLTNGATYAKVLYCGTRRDCETLAGDEPTTFSIDPRRIAAEEWAVRSTRHWDEIAAEIKYQGPKPHHAVNALSWRLGWNERALRRP